MPPIVTVGARTVLLNGACVAPALPSVVGNGRFVAATVADERFTPNSDISAPVDATPSGEKLAPFTMPPGKIAGASTESETGIVTEAFTEFADAAGVMVIDPRYEPA